jgi:hypothetical protein
MLHDDEDGARAGRKIHGAADQRPLVRHPHVPVGEVAIGGDFERAEDRDIDVAAADHRKRAGRIDDRRAGLERDAPARCIDQIGVGRLGRGQRPGADDAVLRMNEKLHVGPHIVGDRDRHAHAEIDHHPVGEILRGAPRHLAAVERLHGR